MKLTLKQLKALGVVDSDKIKDLDRELSDQKKQIQKRFAAATTTEGCCFNRAPQHGDVESECHPQRKLYREIVAKSPNSAIYEAEDVVPGRRFRIDIFLPGSLLAVEYDGFSHHRSKEAFQKDRERQQILVSLGLTLFNVYHGQAVSDISGLADSIISCHLERMAWWDALESSGAVDPEIIGLRNRYLNQIK